MLRKKINFFAQHFYPQKKFQKRIVYLTNTRDNKRKQKSSPSVCSLKREGVAVEVYSSISHHKYASSKKEGRTKVDKKSCKKSCTQSSKENNQEEGCKKSC